MGISAADCNEKRMRCMRMKYSVTIILSVICMLTLVSCAPATETMYRQGIVVDGVFYEKSYQPMPAEVDESAIIGYIESYTDTFPKKDGQTNISKDLKNAPYARVEGGIAILYQNEWYLCTPDETDSSDSSATLPEPDAWDWGLTLSVKDVTDSGLTLVCTQSGGEVTGELETGSDYALKVLENGNWVDVPTIIEEYSWTSEAYLIPKEDSVEFNVNWEWLYGKLPAGTYRITKGFMDFRGSGDYDEGSFEAEFEIK